MKILYIRDLQIESNPSIRNKPIKVKIKLEEYEQNQYARTSGSDYVDLYAGETLGRA